MFFGANRPDEGTLTGPNSPFKDSMFHKHVTRSSRTLQQAEKEWLCRFQFERQRHRYKELEQRK